MLRLQTATEQVLSSCLDLIENHYVCMIAIEIWIEYKVEWTVYDIVSMQCVLSMMGGRMEPTMPSFLFPACLYTHMIMIL